MSLYALLSVLTASLVVGRSACQSVGPIFDAIDAQDDALSALNKDIWENPELAYEEYHAHEVLTDYLEKQGFTVTRSAFNLSTAFVAEYSNGEGRSVSFNSEYDSLPGMGHACGHNLIAISGVAAALGVKEALENQGAKGRVVLFGTPAEEGGGGKIKMLEAGAYDDVDCSLMAHPSNAYYASFYYSLAAWAGDVTWHGASAHAGNAPWLGRNAMDGYVSAYTMAGLFRQQLRGTDRIHHVIRETSQIVNVIPEKAHSMWAVRALDRDRRDVVLERLRTIIDASAAGTNTSVEVEQTLDYWDVVSNRPLAELYYKYLVAHFDPAKNNETSQFRFDNVEDEVDAHFVGGSTDQGNVSHKVPALHAMFPIVSGISSHTPAFYNVSGTDFAYRQAINTAKSLAMVGIDVLRSDATFEAMKEDFNKS
ncbi:hypothetical protein B0I35DRAFT_474233 [Stachybotrys elegans]|uniref:Peptidase M20 domain-containing protein 2 n=1 Tax=Stachybotrys elegans TaxID=80388 RepID=A0A8K0T3A5_9HYPO|nr:hypothetical protein B0I35DRAFT_474233 [Stachybotrys elegans]